MVITPGIDWCTQNITKPKMHAFAKQFHDVSWKWMEIDKSMVSPVIRASFLAKRGWLFQFETGSEHLCILEVTTASGLTGQDSCCFDEMIFHMSNLRCVGASGSWLSMCVASISTIFYRIILQGVLNSKWIQDDPSSKIQIINIHKHP